jgi:hypothetical protein
MAAGIRLLDVAGRSEVGADNVLHGVESSCRTTEYSCECPYITNKKTDFYQKWLICKTQFLHSI